MVWVYTAESDGNSDLNGREYNTPRDCINDSDIQEQGVKDQKNIIPKRLATYRPQRIITVSRVLDSNLADLVIDNEDGVFQFPTEDHTMSGIINRLFIVYKPASINIILGKLDLVK